MIAFLTSNTGKTVFKHGRYKLGCFWQENELLSRLKILWPKKARMLLVASDPDDYDMTEMLLESARDQLNASGLPGRVTMLDRRNQEQAAELICKSDVVQLCGGHVPTQIAWFREIGLSEILQAYEGILIGISAGSMNCARLVYASPEREGEAVDPAYERYVEGMGLVDLVFLPHFQEIIHQEVDGLRILEDIMLPDSYEVPFFTIPDGSYFLWEDGCLSLHGEGYWVEHGEIRQISQVGDVIEL